MKRLYLFAIGGTGVRVLKSMMMLLAAGVKLEVDEIIPIIIDLDSSNGNLQETLRIIESYKRLNNVVRDGGGDFDGFFHTKVSLLAGMNGHHYDLSSKDAFATLAEYIDYDQLSTSDDKFLVDALYSTRNLNSNLNVGFKGNPNIGSITVYKLAQYQEFKDLCSQLTKNDKIMIVGSLFGGTGAAGIPTLLKLLRDPENGLSLGNIRRDIEIGVTAVLPYYRLLEGKGEMIDHSTFMTKAKAALSFYDGAIEEYNAMYYIADQDSVRSYSNHVGGLEQRNPAHYIELFSALSAFHFVQLEDSDYKLTTANGQARKAWFEYGLNSEMNGRINFMDLYEGNTRYANALARFSYVYKYFEAGGYLENKDKLTKCWEIQWAKQQGLLDKNFFCDQNEFFQRELLPYLKDFAAWLHEMEDGSPSFSPINIKVSRKEINNLVEGSYLKKKFFNSPLDFSNMDTEMNTVTKSQWLTGSDEQELNEAKNKNFKLIYLLEKGSLQLFSNHNLLGSVS